MSAYPPPISMSRSQPSTIILVNIFYTSAGLQATLSLEHCEFVHDLHSLWVHGTEVEHL